MGEERTENKNRLGFKGRQAYGTAVRDRLLARRPKQTVHEMTRAEVENSES
jgi:hypothetical protein